MPRRSYQYERDPYGDSYGGGYSGYSPYGRGDRMIDLILAGGDIAAQGAQRSGDIWGSAVGQIGQTLGAGLQGYAETKEQERKAEQLALRDKALVGALESWDGKDARALFSSLGRISDPKTAMEWTQGAMAFQGLTDKADKENAARFQEIGKRMANVSYPVFERLWPGIQPKVAPVAEKFMGIPADQIPAEPTQETYETVRQLFGEKSELIKGQPGEVFFDEDGNPKFSVPAAAKEAKKYQVTVAGPDGRPVTRLATEEELTQGVPGYVAPREGPSLQPKEVLNDAGQPVMANYNSRTGQYVDPTTGQAIRNPQPVASAQEAADAKKFKTAVPVVNAVSELSERINTLQGVEAKAVGEIAKQQAKLNLQDDVAEYEALVSGFTPLVARALGHTGVLTEQDVQSVRALFPRPGDSKSLRDRKVKRIRSIMGEIESQRGPQPAVGPKKTGKIGRFTYEVED